MSVHTAAMSAGTMWAPAWDEVVMGKHLQLGPIDPQLLIQGGAVPARAILEQFNQGSLGDREGPRDARVVAPNPPAKPTASLPSPGSTTGVVLAPRCALEKNIRMPTRVISSPLSLLIGRVLHRSWQRLAMMHGRAPIRPISTMLP